MAWLSRRSGKKVPARQPGEGVLAPLEDAPGSYVKVRASE
jgi:polyhydroxyalkanoate synthase